MNRFDVCGPLPSGVTLLEASAGTGKTYTIAALVARYVAAGVPLERMLLVTFGRMATGELRARVRERLVATAAALAGDVTSDDEIVRLLAANATTSQARLAAAVANFDTASITTTHGFCHQVLSGMGLGGDVDRTAAIVEDVDDLVDEVVDDLYLRRFYHELPPKELRLKTAREIGRAVVHQPAALIVPDDDPDRVAAMRVRLAKAVRAAVEERKRRQRILTYDDLLLRVRAGLADPAAVRRLRVRFDVVLVDEFQDTDPVQWDIVRTAFGDGDTTLVLIGDPKQAIYSFRGADVHTYLAARPLATTMATLDRNWRSDAALVDAYDALFDGMTLGHEGIEYRTVTAAGQRHEPVRHGAPLRVRVLHRDDERVSQTDQGWASAPSSRALIAADVAADIAELLASGATVVDAAPRPVGPGDIAVLVRSNAQGAQVRDALDAVGVPAVLGGAGSVFATPVAAEWLALLQALERPTSGPRAHTAALGAFFGWTVERVATATDDEWEDVHVRLHEWAAVLRNRGVAALVEAVTRQEQLPARLLGREDGERRLTDLRHIGELLHHAAITERLGTIALVAWLRERIRESADEQHDEDRSRRLESDSAAVQILTIHRSKGLEMPIVYCPFLWQEPYVDENGLPVFHDGVRMIDAGGRTGTGHKRRKELHETEELGESLRLAYVALTRAKHQAVVHWATSWDSRRSPLARILFGAELRMPPEEDEVMDRVGSLAPGLIAAERMVERGKVRWRPPQVSSSALAVRTFDRGLDDAWRRASYSGLTALAKQHGVTSEPEAPGIVDEQIDLAGASLEAPDDGDRAALGAVSLPLAVLPGGARFGTIVHHVLEGVDFAVADLGDELRRALDDHVGRDEAILGREDDLVDGLRLAIETPLGPLAGDLRLRDIARADRLDELEFELPIAGGDIPTGQYFVGALGPLLERHLPADDPLRGYSARLVDPQLQQRVHGYLTGSLDAVLRLPGTVPRFAVVDYKTNWLAAPGTDISAWDYRPAALSTAMEHAHYPVQALFYAVALHRYLRWRLPGYDPDVHLAGVLYLFLRGMVGQDTPRVGGQPCGVFAWRPPSALVEAVSDLFDLGVPGE